MATKTKINFNQLKGSMVNALDYMTANEVLYCSTFGTSGIDVDMRASLDLAFAQVGKMVYCPAGRYRIWSNLAMPTCVGIVGDGWNPSSSSVGTIFEFLSPVTVGFDLGGTSFHYFGGINIYGGSTSGATGLRLGYGVLVNNLMNHSLIENVRIWSFPGTSIGMFMADINFCDIRKIWINDCNTNIYASSTFTGTPGGNSTVPTDVNMYGVTSFQSRANNFDVKTLGANIYGMKLMTSVGAALVTGGLSDTGAMLNTDLAFYGLSLEYNNSGTWPIPSPYWSLNISHSAATSGYGQIRLYDVGHDAKWDKFLTVSGDRSSVVVHSPSINSATLAWTVDHFNATASGRIMIDGYPGVQMALATRPDLWSVSTETISGKITGPEVRKAVTLVCAQFSPTITVTGYYYLNGKQVTLYIPQFSGTPLAASTTFVITGIPSEITPSTEQRYLVGVRDNSVFNTGLLVVGTAYTLTVYPTIGTTVWSAFLIKALIPTTITYLLP